MMQERARRGANRLVQSAGNVWKRSVGVVGDVWRHNVRQPLDDEEEMIKEGEKGEMGNVRPRRGASKLDAAWDGMRRVGRDTRKHRYIANSAWDTYSGSWVGVMDDVRTRHKWMGDTSGKYEREMDYAKDEAEVEKLLFGVPEREQQAKEAVKEDIEGKAVQKAGEHDAKHGKPNEGESAADNEPLIDEETLRRGRARAKGFVEDRLDLGKAVGAWLLGRVSRYVPNETRGIRVSNVYDDTPYVMFCIS